MKRFVLSRTAAKDLDQIEAYLSTEAGVEVSQRIIRELRKSIRFLARNPASGHLRSDLATRPLKFWAVRSYLIIYDPAAHPVEIVRVLHGARDVAKLL